ncbi:MAG: helix-hairpin-helix domain-containing protein [Candidatus Helarchaeota archaeon]
MELDLKDTKEKLMSELKKCKIALKINKEMQDNYNLEIRELKEIRDKNNESVSKIIEKAKEEKIIRDSYNREFQQLKERKNIIRDQIAEYKAERDSKWILYREFKNQFHELLNQKKRIKKNSGKFNRIITEILELDWKLQTESMNFEKEKELVHRIEELNSKINQDKDYCDIKMIDLELNELIKNLDEFRTSANHYHQMIINLFPELQKLQDRMDELHKLSDEHHNKLMEYSNQINELKKISDDAHQKMIEKIKALQLLRKGYDSKLEELKGIEDRLNRIRQKESRIRRESFLKIEEERAKELLKRHKANEQLSFDEIGFLLNKGLITLEEIKTNKNQNNIEISSNIKNKLTEIKGLGVRDEKILMNNGICTIKDLSNCSVEYLSELIPFKSTIKLRNWIENAKSLVNKS